VCPPTEFLFGTRTLNAREADAAADCRAGLMGIHQQERERWTRTTWRELLAA